ncbi:glycohydrolase toxin TNT-related protein [Actinomadura napierensis]|uniref:TNT domain-containing protein n=1 Tax=Actinomadura napierensis TaxID=267854 RepID=A0ABN3AD82_9ACTN
MTAPPLPATPQDEHDLVARLAPESPILFFRARRLLRDWTRDGTARFAVGRLEDGCWSILHGDGGWHAVRSDGGRPAEHTAHGTARAALARAVGALLTEAGTGLNMKVFQLAGITRPAPDDLTDWGPWYLTETGERLRAESENGPRPGPEVPCVALRRLLGRERGYFTLRRESAPEQGGFVTVRQVFELAVHRELPERPGEPSEVLPAGTVLDCYGDTGQVFLYEPGTPFHKRGIPGMAEQHAHRFYRLQRPLRVYPAFPLEHTIIPNGRVTATGRGHYLVDSIADLLRDGHLAETADPHEEPAP